MTVSVGEDGINLLRGEEIELGEFFIRGVVQVNGRFMEGI